MSNKLTIAISAAFLVIAAAASVATAASSRPLAHLSTTNAVATVCSELSSPLHAGRCAVGPYCFDFHIGDRTVGPTFPTWCRQAT